jgi:response regulator RpfG family c-di-GMP phosphodiesterase
MSANVLIVDDEAPIRELFGFWLEGAGYRCHSAASAQEALAVASSDTLDVALLDLRMPGESGIWLAKQLRDRCQDMALVMVTGAQSFDAAVEGMRLGILDYLLKPFGRDELLRAVERAVEWAEAARRERGERARLEAEIQRRSCELSSVFADLRVTSIGALEALLVTLNTRHPDAFAHARRVARMAVALSQRLGIADAALSDVNRGALLHDIGKIAMPDALLHKPGPLTQDEIAIIRTHPQIGHDIVAVVPFLQPAADIIFASHEWFDGSGYPRGLASDQIPLGARIVSIADTFDALTQSRVYRDGVSGERAAAELVRKAGIQFDPALVHLWLRLAEHPDPAWTEDTSMDASDYLALRSAS